MKIPIEKRDSRKHGPTSTTKHLPPLRYDLRGFAVQLCRDLETAGIPFADNGFPILPQKAFAIKIPQNVLMYPCSKASQSPAPSRTILCCFERDRDLIRHLRHLNERIVIWQHFFAFAGFDLSVCNNRPIAEQIQNLWINSLVTAFVASKGIRIVPNFRCGSLSSVRFMASYPQGVPVAVGAHGSARIITPVDIATLKLKIGMTRPSEALVYGTTEPRCRRVLAETETTFRCFPDYRSICRAAKRRGA